jgi:hypothetical protein
MNESSRGIEASSAVEAAFFSLNTLAAFVLVGVVLGIVGAISAGDAGDLLAVRTLVVFVCSAGLCAWFLVLARRLRRGSRAAGVVSVVTLLVVAAATVSWSIVDGITVQEGDAGGYVLMGAAMIALLCVIPGAILAWNLVPRGTPSTG